MANHFDKPDIDLRNKHIVAVFTAYNELDRVEFFLSYYRSMGVDHFFAIDNASNDGTGEMLKAQPDVSYFHTASSYVESKAGRLWTSELANHYCVGKWCLTLDLDEMLVFPGSDKATLRDLCEYLDEFGYEGIFTIFLDMYSRDALSEAVYTSGQPFLDVCDYYEPTNYTLMQSMHFPHVGVFGGPRQRVFWEEGKRGRGPSMRKLPLIKWKEGFRYFYSTHSSTPVNLADITGALMHFKFFSSFKSFAAREVARGDRVQADDYINYARLVKEANIVFRTKQSVQYKSSTSLMEHGVMVCTFRYINWLVPRMAAKVGRRAARKYEQTLRSAMRIAMDGAVLRLSQLPIIWSLLSSSNDGGVIAVRDRTILGWFIDRVGRFPTREIEAQVDGTVVAVGATGVQVGDQAQISQDHRGNLFEIVIPDNVFAHADSCKIFLASRRDPVPFASVILRRNSELGSADKFEGSCHFSAEGRIVGWVWSPLEPDRSIGVSVHIDGKFWCRISASRFRESLQTRGIGNGTHGFSIDLPDWLEPNVAHIAHIAVEGTNMQLRKSPLEFVPMSLKTSEPAPDFKPDDRDVIWTEAKNVFLPKSGIKIGNVIGQVLAVRQGIIHGWIADESDWTRIMTIEVVAGNRVRRVVSANTKIPVVADVPPHLQGHGFSLPVVPSWSPPLLQRSFHHVSLRAEGSFFAQDIRVAGPRLKLHQSTYDGFFDRTNNGNLQGWAWHVGYPEDRVDVAIFVDGKLLVRVRAANHREDLRDVGIGRGFHGFSVPIPRSLRTGKYRIDAVIAEEGISLSAGRLVLSDGVVMLEVVRSKFRSATLERLVGPAR